MNEEIKSQPMFFKDSNNLHIAYHKIEASDNNKDKPTIIFNHGLMSDMDGDKAIAIEEHCKNKGLGFIRFDCLGHGKSDDEFINGYISLWRQNQQEVIEKLGSSKNILIGSSMGGWLSLLNGVKMADKVAGIIGLAAAPDFTCEMYEEYEEIGKQIKENGVAQIPTGYGDTYYPFTKKLIEDGYDNCLLNKETIEINCPITLIQGQEDKSVYWQKALKIADKVITNQAKVVLIKDANHSLSRPEDIDVILRELDCLLAKV